MAGYVYLVEEVPHCSGESGPWTKIGCSKNPPEWRIGANLTRGNPRKLNLAVVYQFEPESDAYAAEAKAHARFRQFSHQKEWFQVSWQQVAEWGDGIEHWQRRNESITL